MAVNRQAHIGLAWALVLGACASAPKGAVESPIALAGTDGANHPFPELAKGAPATVLLFFSGTCPCVSAHDARARALWDRFSARGVRVFEVDSEYGSTVERDRAEAKQRSYPFPILVDADARLANELGAQFALFVAVYDAGGVLRYRGGFDSDKSVLTEDARPWLAEALESVLAGQPIAQANTKPMGCALRRW